MTATTPGHAVVAANPAGTPAPDPPPRLITATSAGARCGPSPSPGAPPPPPDNSNKRGREAGIRPGTATETDNSKKRSFVQEERGNLFHGGRKARYLGSNLPRNQTPHVSGRITARSAERAVMYLASGGVEEGADGEDLAHLG